MNSYMIVYTGAGGCIWVCIDVYGCNGLQKRQNEVRWARGAVGMHDLWTRVVEKFPHIRNFARTQQQQIRSSDWAKKI